MQISTKKVNKTIALLRKLQNILPRPALLTIYKYFVRTHLYYGNIIYDQAFNSSSHQKFESPLQYNELTLAIKVSLEKRRGKKIIKGKVWNPCNKDIGLENYV